MSAPKHLAGGKPADAEDFVLARRFRLATLLAPPGGGTLLDFGCGNGAQTRWFAGEFEAVVGVDVDRAFLRQFRSALAAEGATASPQPLLYDGLSVPLSDASVDYVISFEVLEHVADEGRALAEIHRVLRPGGRLVISVPNRWWLFETHGARLPLLRWNRVPFFSWLPKSLHDRWAHARIYRRREILAKLRAAGFRIQDSIYVTAPMDVVRWTPLRNFLRSTVFRSDRTMLPFLATAVLVVAERRAP